MSDKIDGGVAYREGQTEHPLIGRHQQMKVATGHIEKAMAGRGSILMISGDAGIGKTRLLQEVIHQASTYDFGCLHSRCIGDDPDPFSVIKEIIVQLKKMGEKIEDLEISDLSWDELKGRLIQRILFLAHSRPFLIAIEDLHWADTMTLNLLHTLGRRVSDSRILVIGTYRKDEVDDQLSQGASSLVEVMNVLRKQTDLIDLSLDQLSKKDVDLLIDERLGSDSVEDVKEIVVEQSLGNPLFVLENLKLMKETRAIYKRGSKWHLDETKYVPLATGIHNVIAKRLDHIHADNKEILGLFSVLGSPFSDQLAHAMLSSYSSLRSKPNIRQVPTDLAMVRYDGGSYSFEHEVVRRAIYDGLVEKERREYHHIAAIALTSIRDEEVGHPILSYHYYQANVWDDALVHSLEASREARKKQANREAEIFLERALRSFENSSPTSEPEQQIEIFEGLGDLHYYFARFDTSIAFFNQALEVAVDNETKARLLRKLSSDWGNKDDFVHLDKAQQLIEQASEVEGISYAETLEILCASSILFFYQRDFERAIEYASQARDGYMRCGLSSEAFWETVHIAMFKQQMGMTREAWNDLEEASLQIGSVTIKEALMEYYGQRVELSMAHGDYDDSIRAMDKLIPLHDELGFYADMSYDHWMRGLIWSLREEHEKALEDALLAVKFATIDEMRRAVIRSNVLLAHQQLMVGDIRSAEEALDRNSLMAEEEGLSSKAIGTGLYWVVLAELHLMKGSDGISSTEINDGLTIIDKNEITPLFGAIARFWYGVTLFRMGDRVRSQKTLSEAVESFRALSNTTQEKLIINKYLYN